MGTCVSTSGDDRGRTSSRTKLIVALPFRCMLSPFQPVERPATEQGLGMALTALHTQKQSPRSPYPGSPGYPNPGAPIHHVPNHAVPVHMVRASPPPQLVRATPPPPPVIQEKVVEKPVYVEVEKVVGMYPLTSISILDDLLQKNLMFVKCMHP